MKLTDLTPEQIAAYQAAGQIADANYFTDKLARLQRRFALAHERHQLALDLEDMSAKHRGMVTVTISGPTGTLTFDGYDIMNEAGMLSEPASDDVELIRAEILRVLTDLEGFRDKAMGPNEMAGTELQRELHALCMPAAPAAPAPACALTPVAA